MGVTEEFIKSLENMTNNTSINDIPVDLIVRSILFQSLFLSNGFLYFWQDGLKSIALKIRVIGASKL